MPGQLEECVSAGNPGEDQRRLIAQPIFSDFLLPGARVSP
jgi:hypothetical protein